MPETIKDENQLRLAVNYEGEYEKVKPYAEKIGRKYANKINQPNLDKDFSQEYLAAYFNPTIIKNAIRDDGSIIRNFAGFIAQRRLIEYIRKHYIVSRFNLEPTLVFTSKVGFFDDLQQPSYILDNLIFDEDIDYINYLITRLNNNWQRAIQLVYIDGIEQKQASIEMGITQGRISQILKAALVRMNAMCTI